VFEAHAGHACSTQAVCPHTASCFGCGCDSSPLPVRCRKAAPQSHNHLIMLLLLLLLLQFAKGSPPGSWARLGGSWHNTVRHLPGLSGCRWRHYCRAWRIPLLQHGSVGGSAQDHRHTGEQEEMLHPIGQRHSCEQTSTMAQAKHRDASLLQLSCTAPGPHTLTCLCAVFCRCAGDGSWERACHSPC
jgi:hypothetical protein